MWVCPLLLLKPQPVHRSRDDDEQRSAFHKWHRQPQRAKTDDDDDDDEMTSTYGSLSGAARPPPARNWSRFSPSLPRSPVGMTSRRPFLQSRGGTTVGSRFINCVATRYGLPHFASDDGSMGLCKIRVSLESWQFDKSQDGIAGKMLNLTSSFLTAYCMIPCRYSARFHSLRLRPFPPGCLE